MRTVKLSPTTEHLAKFLANRQGVDVDCYVNNLIHRAYSTFLAGEILNTETVLEDLELEEAGK